MIFLPKINTFFFAAAQCHKEAVYKCGVCQLKIPDDHIQVWTHFIQGTSRFGNYNNSNKKHQKWPKFYTIQFHPLKRNPKRNSFCFQLEQEVSKLCLFTIVQIFTTVQIFTIYKKVNKTYFHPRCMKCQVCGELQTSRYITYKDLPICEEDYKVRNEMMIAKQNLSRGAGPTKCLRQNEKSER